MILIASAAYVNSEFQIEFGKIPPSFLPVGNKRLFEHQIESLKHRFPGEKIFLSYPRGYQVAEKDKIFLLNANVTAVEIDANISLGNSLAYFLDRHCEESQELRLIHGDTLIFDMPTASNCVATAKTLSGYDWEVDEMQEEGELVWCGYFSIGDVKMFRACIDKAGGDFVKSIHLYGNKNSLEHIQVREWHDYGHLNTYFQSRTYLTTERSFNQLKVEDGSIKKYGQPAEKIKAESFWFKNIPSSIKIYTPNYISDGDDYYELEYLPLLPLNELFVHGKNIELFWVKVFGLCDQFFMKCLNQKIVEGDLKKIQASRLGLIKNKTLQRFSEFVNDKQIDPYKKIHFDGVIMPPLQDIVEDCILRACEMKVYPGVSHGDFCFSNILFDSRIDRIKVIDPRGLDADGEQTIHGDLAYDLAKLAHSVVGLYDFIVAGAFDYSLLSEDEYDRYSLTIYTDQRIRNIQNIFMGRKYLGGIDIQSVMPLVVLLFISMLPLHADNPRRQMGLLVNAIRLYREHFMGDKA